MQVTVLGSSGGYPAPGTACSGYLVEADETRLWVDAGSGTFSRLLALCPLPELTAALVTHLHADHWTDLPLAIHTLRFAVDLPPLPIYGPPGWTETMGIVAEWAREEDAVFEAREIREGETIEVGALKIEPIRVLHSDQETFGLRIAAGGTTVAYTADTGPCDALEELARDADLLICEAGAPEGVNSEMHLSGRQAGEVAARAGAKSLLLTHLRPEADREQVLADARTAFSGPVELATEGHSLGL